MMHPEDIKILVALLLFIMLAAAFPPDKRPYASGSPTTKEHI